MKKIQLGNTDLSVAPFNLGGNAFGWTVDKAKSFTLLDHYLGKGFNFVDTADMYSYWANGGEGGQSETIIGEWMKDRKNRHDVVLATKVGGEIGDQPINASANHILQGVDKSLQRLQTDYIDLYYLHYDDQKTPVEETLEAFEKLKQAGKIRHIAASNISPERLSESLNFSKENGISSYQVLQPLYNLVEREGYEKNYASLAKEHNLTVFPYYALASGFLTGKYRSKDDLGKSPRGQGLTQYLHDRGLSVLNALDEISKKHNTSQAAVSLAWLASKPSIGGPIASATSTEQLDQILQSTEISLDQSDVEKLDSASQY